MTPYRVRKLRSVTFGDFGLTMPFRDEIGSAGRVRVGRRHLYVVLGEVIRVGVVRSAASLEAVAEAVTTHHHQRLIHHSSANPFETSGSVETLRIVNPKGAAPLYFTSPNRRQACQNRNSRTHIPAAVKRVLGFRRGAG
jgi:hypothetical protein